ncbi:MAG: hypothetical protein ABJC19_08525 [Gemmatimonadota bacterium]
MNTTAGKTAWWTLLVVAVVVGAGAYLLGRRQIDPLAWLARFKGTDNPVTLAKAMHNRCGVGTTNPTECYSATFDSLAAAGKVRLAMQTLEQLKTLDPSVAPAGHVFAHGIGISAGKGGGSIASVFAQCDESNEAGCYHGVLQAYFNAATAVGSTEVNAVCAPFRGATANQWLLFQCVHGAGHGLTMYYGHDAPRALSDCDFFPDEWSRRSCYAGVFMENIVNVQMASREGHGLSAHEGMHMPGMGGGAESTFKPLDKKDLLYPCSIMAERYLFSCYEMQTAAILYQNGGNIGAAAKTCDTAPHDMRYVCYQSLGRDISAYALADHQKGITLCNMGTEAYRPWCFVGLAKAFVNRNARADDGIALCRDVADSNGKLKCYEAVGEMIGTLRNSVAERQALCEPSEDSYRAACLFGARVINQPPEALWKLNTTAAS